MGAMADLMAIKKLPFIIVIMPILILVIHAAILFSASKLVKVTRAELALTSQLLIGGPGLAIAFAQAKFLCVSG